MENVFVITVTEDDGLFTAVLVERTGRGLSRPPAFRSVGNTALDAVANVAIQAANKEAAAQMKAAADQDAATADARMEADIEAGDEFLRGLARTDPEARRVLRERRK